MDPQELERRLGAACARAHQQLCERIAVDGLTAEETLAQIQTHLLRQFDIAAGLLLDTVVSLGNVGWYRQQLGNFCDELLPKLEKEIQDLSSEDEANLRELRGARWLYIDEGQLAGRLHLWMAEAYERCKVVAERAGQAPAVGVAAVPELSRLAFLTKESRDNALKNAGGLCGGQKALATQLAVNYSDLRKWARLEPLAKGSSDKQTRIEDGLRNLLNSGTPKTYG